MRHYIFLFSFLFLAFTPISAHAQDSSYDDRWGRDNPFDSQKDDWSRRFDDRTSSDDRFKTDRPRDNNQLENSWRQPRQKRQTIGDIQRRQLNTIGD